MERSGSGSTPTLPGVGKCFKFMSVLLLTPFGWNQKEGSLRSRSRVSLYYWILTGVVLTALHSLSALAILVKVIHKISRNNAWDNVNHLMGLTLSMLLILANVNFTSYAVVILRNYYETIKFYNEFIRFRVFLQEAGAPLKNNISVFKSMSILLLIRVCSSVSLCASHPEKPLFLYWAIPESWKSPTVHKAYVIFNIIYSLTYWSTLFFTVTTLFVFVETIQATLEFRNSQKKIKMIEEIRFYRQLLILSRLFDSAFGAEGVPAYFSFVTTMLTFATYGVVRFYGRVIFKLYVSFLSPFLGINAVYACLLPRAAILKEQSQELLRKIYRELPLEKKQYGRAALRSFPDLGLRVANYFTVDRKTYIAILGFALYNALTLLITL